MGTLIALRGLSGSGKSTWARRWVAQDPRHRRRVSTDDLRRELHGPAHAWTPDQERQIAAQARRKVLEALAQGHDVVIDATHTRPGDLDPWRDLAREGGHTFVVHETDPDLTRALERNERRAEAGGRRVPPEVIHAQHQRLRSQATPTGTVVPAAQEPTKDEEEHEPQQLR